MKATSTSLSLFLTILLLAIAHHSTASPIPKPKVAEAPTRMAGDDAPSQSNAPVPANLLAQLQASFEQMQMNVREARETVSHVTQQRDAAQQEAARLTAANDELRAQLDAARAELDEARREAVQARHAAARTRLELEDVRQGLATAQQERDEQRREAQRLQGKLDAGREAFDLLASLRDELQATFAEVEGLKRDVVGVRAALEAPAERQALKTQVRKLEQDRQRLTEQLASEQQRRADSRQRLEALEQSVAARDLHKRELLKSMMSLESRLDSAEARSTSASGDEQVAQRVDHPVAVPAP